ncbi:MAG: IS4 family transposase [Candidatus Sabulitectum sp.]|nr:IS4 family transposase [Candidatus Sabulitectum sp.]
MYSGRFVFSQVMDHLPYKSFARIVNKYSGDYKIQHFSCKSQFYCMAFGQLTYRNSLRDIIMCLNANQNKLYHMGIRGTISRNNLSNANMNRDWRIYAELAQVLISTARKLYADEKFSDQINEPVYALDSTTISMSLSLFPWAEFRKSRGGIKLHTLLELPSSIPTFIDITAAKPHDVNILDRIILEPGAYYVMDMGYMDFTRLFRITQSGAFFVTRAKRNVLLKRRYSLPRDKSQRDILSDQIVFAEKESSYAKYPAVLRRIRYRDPEEGNVYLFLTNNFDLEASTIATLYKGRWQVELFFKWIKQHLRIQTFFGHSLNAVKTQIWIGVSVYVLVSIIRKRLNLENLSLYNILQVLSVSPFCYDGLQQLFTDDRLQESEYNNPNQLSLFDL